MPSRISEPRRLDPAAHLGELLLGERGELLGNAEAVLGDLRALPARPRAATRPTSPSRRGRRRSPSSCSAAAPRPRPCSASAPRRARRRPCRCSFTSVSSPLSDPWMIFIALSSSPAPLSSPRRREGTRAGTMPRATSNDSDRAQVIESAAARRIGVARVRPRWIAVAAARGSCGFVVDSLSIRLSIRSRSQRSEAIADRSPSARQDGANAIRCRPDHSSDGLLSIRLSICCRFLSRFPARREVRVERKSPPSWTDRHAGARIRAPRKSTTPEGCRFGCRFRAFPAGATRPFPGAGKAARAQVPEISERRTPRRARILVRRAALDRDARSSRRSQRASPCKPARHRAPGARRATAADLHWSAGRDGSARAHSSRRSRDPLRRRHHETGARRGPGAALPCLSAPRLLPARAAGRSRRLRRARGLLPRHAHGLALRVRAPGQRAVDPRRIARRVQVPGGGGLRVRAARGDPGDDASPSGSRSPGSWPRPCRAS